MCVFFFVILATLTTNYHCEWFSFGVYFLPDNYFHRESYNERDAISCMVVKFSALFDQ